MAEKRERATPRVYSSDKIERSLYLADKRREEGKPLSELRALKVGLNHARHYEGPDRNNYLERIEQKALILEQNETLKDYEYEEVQGIEEDAVELRRRDSKRKGLPFLLPAIMGVVGLITGLFFLSSNLTGNVISNLSLTSSSIIGAVLFLVGIVGAFFYFKRKDKK